MLACKYLLTISQDSRSSLCGDGMRGAGRLPKPLPEGLERNPCEIVNRF